VGFLLRPAPRWLREVDPLHKIHCLWLHLPA
jgi:hypothetical protein